LRRPNVPESDFIIGRIGTVAKWFLCGAAQPSMPARPDPWMRRTWLLAGRVFRKARLAGLSLLMTRLERRAINVGLFRLHGEPHLWMYDRCSLAELMANVGFRHIDSWAGYNLDTNADGSEHQPASLYMEGVRTG
jgi:hypothetical protein